MKKFIVLFAILFNLKIAAQEVTANTPEAPKEILSDQIKNAEFPGGLSLFREQISKNFRLKKIKAKGKESCTVSFIIERDGTMTNIEATGTNESFNKEAILAVSKIKNKWIAATLNGNVVRSKYKVPLTINFE